MKKSAAYILSVICLLAFNGCASTAPRAEEVAREYLPRIVEIVGPSGTGSGLIYKGGGGEVLVLTNYHVSGDQGGALSLRFFGSAGFINTDTAAGSAVEVVGYDKYYDLALLRVNLPEAPSYQLPRFDFRPEAGEEAYSIGNGLALGVGVGNGCLSGCTFINLAAEGHKVLVLLQTTAPVNQGCSGGALVTAGGVAGICSYKQITFNGDYVQDVNFAVPARVAAKVCERILSVGGSIARINVTATASRSFNLAGKLTLVEAGGVLKVRGGDFDGEEVTAINGGDASPFALMAACYGDEIVLKVKDASITIR